MCTNPQHSPSCNCTEYELECLVRVANEGMRARDRLATHFLHAVEYVDDDRPGTSIKFFSPKGVKACYAVLGSEFRIKPQPRPLPEPIYVGPAAPPPECRHWKVELSEDRKTVKVGCQIFGADFLCRSLALLCKDGVDSIEKPAAANCFSASRKGVFHGHSGQTLSWADADRLLAFLEEGLKE